MRVLMFGWEFPPFLTFMNVLTDIERPCAAERPARPWVVDGEMAVAG